MTSTTHQSTSGSRRSQHGWIVAYGVVSIIVGLVAFAYPITATYSATVLVGVGILLIGASALGAGIAAKGVPHRGYLIALGIVSLIVGGVALADPLVTAVSVTILLAIWLGARGVMEIAAGATLRRGLWWLGLLGVLNLVLAFYTGLYLLPASLVVPGYILGFSLLSGGIAALATTRVVA